MDTQRFRNCRRARRFWGAERFAGRAGWLLILSLMTSMACGAKGSAPASEMLAREMVAAMPSGESVVLEVARSEAERAKGLMGRPEVPRGTGMIFLFDGPGEHPIWMFHCLTALDLIWLDERRRVVHIVEQAPVCPEEPCQSYFPDRPATIVIELGPGEAQRLGLRLGARVLLSPLGAEG